MQSIESRLDDIKTMIVTTITNDDLKITANGVFKYRSLVEFLLAIFKMDVNKFLESTDNWEILTEKASYEIITQETPRERMYGIFIVFRDRKFINIRMPMKRIMNLDSDWNEFKRLNTEAKEAIINAIKESDSMNIRLGRISDMTYEDYIKVYERRNSHEIDEEDDANK